MKKLFINIFSDFYNLVVLYLIIFMIEFNKYMIIALRIERCFMARYDIDVVMYICMYVTTS
jgi:hypothetical protein